MIRKPKIEKFTAFQMKIFKFSNPGERTLQNLLNFWKSHNFWFFLITLNEIFHQKKRKKFCLLALLLIILLSSLERSYIFFIFSNQLFQNNIENFAVPRLCKSSYFYIRKEHNFWFFLSFHSDFSLENQKFDARLLRSLVNSILLFPDFFPAC